MPNIIIINDHICWFYFIATYSNISDDQLDQLVREAQNLNPNTGIRLTKGFLVGKGHQVQFHGIRDSLVRVGVMECRSRTVTRRYQVHGPLSSWHIDGNGKLIR